MAAGALTAALVAGCSSEQTSFTLAVTATPNPVAGTDGAGGRRWDYQIAITNTSAVGVRVASFHAGVSDTDTGNEEPLVLVKQSGVVGTYIAAGATQSYAANRESGGRFASGTERRIYHCLGDDGDYYSGEVKIELR